jgi:hypothetical protein
MRHPSFQPLSCGQGASLSGGLPPSCHYGATGILSLQKSKQAGTPSAEQVGRSTGSGPMVDPSSWFLRVNG